MKIFFDFLASAKLAVWVLVILLVLIALGSVLPQAGSFTPHEIHAWQNQYPLWAKVFVAFEYLNFFSIFQCKIFFLTLGLLFVNLFCCTLKRCLARKEWNYSPFSLTGSGWWGFTILHVALLFMTAGVLIHQKYSDHWKFLVREKMWLEKDMFRQAAHTIPDLEFRLFFHKFQIEYQGDVVTKRSFDLLVQKPYSRPWLTTVAVNKPFTYQGYSFTMDDYGFAPYFRLRHTPSGWQTGPHPAILPPLEKNISDCNIFSFAHELQLRIDIFPNALDAKEGLQHIAYEPQKPVFMLSLWQNKKLLGSQLIQYDISKRQAISCQIGEYEISLTRLDYWCSFLMSYNPMLYFIYFSMWLCIVGFVIRYCRTII